MKVPKSSIVILVVWVAVFILAFLAPRLMVTEGDGLTRGLNRVGAFFLWQLGAAFLSVILAFIAWTKMRDRPFLKWLFSSPLILHLILLIFVIGFVLFANFRKPQPEAYDMPVTSTSTTTAPIAIGEPATEPVMANKEQQSVSLDVQTYMGIYKSGFEMSHFYTMDGQGPWWLEMTDEDDEKLQSYYVERPGRGGGITVAMTVSAYLNDIGPGFNHLGPIDKKLHIVSIGSVRQLSLEEFDQVLQTVQRK